MCCNNCQLYVHVRFHDQFIIWYQNSYMIYVLDFFWIVGGDYHLVHVGFCGAVNIGHDEDLELWLQLEYRVIASLVPVAKSELIGEGVWSEVLILGAEWTQRM